MIYKKLKEVSSNEELERVEFYDEVMGGVSGGTITTIAEMIQMEKMKAFQGIKKGPLRWTSKSYEKITESSPLISNEYETVNKNFKAIGWS